jgi:transcriptional regulator with XRE-family HTH domain
MTPEELQTFQAQAHYSNQEMANLLGIGLRTYIGWRTGRNPIPKLMDLYMAADHRLFGRPPLGSAEAKSLPAVGDQARVVVGEVENWADSIEDDGIDDEAMRRMHAIAKHLIERLARLQQKIEDEWGSVARGRSRESDVEA